jgi:hypothetical protein
MNFQMFSDDALAKFRTFCEAANMKAPSPQGAFDQAMPKTSQRKEIHMRYVPFPNTANSLFTRERSNVMAYDEVNSAGETAQEILRFLTDKISEQDLAQVRELLMIEAGEKPDSVKDAEQLNRAARSRGAQDSSLSSFDARFPSAHKIGRDDMIGRR